MPKTLTITLTDAQHQALTEMVDAQINAPGVPAAATVEEYCARMFTRAVLRPAIEQFPSQEMKRLRKAREKALKEYDDAAEPTIAVSIT